MNYAIACFDVCRAVKVTLPFFMAASTVFTYKFPATTGQVNIPFNAFLFSGFCGVSTVPAGNYSNASFVGANTAKVLLPSKVSTRSVAFTAAINVVWSLDASCYINNVNRIFCYYIER